MMIGFKSGLLSSLLASWLFIMVPGLTYADETVSIQMPELYQVQSGDVLEVGVWGEADLTREILIRPDGHFSMPLIGEIDARRKTVPELRTELGERFAAFVPDADIYVAVRQLTGNRIYVIGNVARPGEFPIVRPTDVMQVLSIAGGPTSFAALDDIIVLRRGAEGQNAIPFHYGDIIKGRHLDQNILLQSGDVIVVP